MPVLTSAILGARYLSLGETKPIFKVLGIAFFLSALYLQFASAHSLAGLLLQSGLALSLALWRAFRA